MKEILKKQEEERKKNELSIRKAQEKVRKFQEEQEKIDEDAKKRNLEIERLNGKINDNLSKTGSMIKSGAVTSASSLLIMASLEAAGVPCTAVIGTAAKYALLSSMFGGIGLVGLATIPLLLAGGYALKKLAT